MSVLQLCVTSAERKFHLHSPNFVPFGIPQSLTDSNRYKPDVNLRFVTEELGFESDAEAVQFIIDHNGQDLLEERPDYIAFATGKAGQRFEALRAEAFRRVDIKGQI